MTYPETEWQPTPAFRCAQVLCMSGAAVATIVSLLWLIWLVWPAVSRERQPPPQVVRHVEEPVHLEVAPAVPSRLNAQPVSGAKGRKK
jgi:hypothetical protein